MTLAYVKKRGGTDRFLAEAGKKSSSTRSESNVEIVLIEDTLFKVGGTFYHLPSNNSHIKLYTLSRSYSSRLTIS